MLRFWFGGSTHLVSPFRLLNCLGEKSSDSARGLPTATALVNHTMFQLKFDSHPFPISNNKNKKHVGLRNSFQSSCAFCRFLISWNIPIPIHVMLLCFSNPQAATGIFTSVRAISTPRCYNTCDRTGDSDLDREKIVVQPLSPPNLKRNISGSTLGRTKMYIFCFHSLEHFGSFIS